ncbi:unnamed protein product [Musa banksii]
MRTSPSLFLSLVFLSLLRSVFPMWIGKQTVQLQSISSLIEECD